MLKSKQKQGKHNGNVELILQWHNFFFQCKFSMSHSVPGTAWSSAWEKRKPHWPMQQQDLMINLPTDDMKSLQDIHRLHKVRDRSDYSVLMMSWCCLWLTDCFVHTVCTCAHECLLSYVRQVPCAREQKAQDDLQTSSDFHLWKIVLFQIV